RSRRRRTGAGAPTRAPPDPCRPRRAARATTRTAAGRRRAPADRAARKRQPSGGSPLRSTVPPSVWRSEIRPKAQNRAGPPDIPAYRGQLRRYTRRRRATSTRPTPSTTAAPPASTSGVVFDPVTGRTGPALGEAEAEADGEAGA